MIEVPVAVKEALKDGRLKKEYKIKVFHYGEYWRDIFRFDYSHYVYDITESDSYKLVSDTDFIFAYQRGGDYTLIYPEYIEGHYESEVLRLEQGDMLYDYNGGGSTIVVVSQLVNEPPVIVDDFTLDNSKLVDESVLMDERMCSDSDIKYGLTEGTSIEFQYFGENNIKDKFIQVFIEIQYKDNDDSIKWYEIPIGYFDVENCTKQASTGIYKVIAYNRIKSSELDAVINDLIDDSVWFRRVRQDQSYDEVTTIDMLINDMLVGISTSAEYFPVSDYYYESFYPSIDDREGGKYTCIESGKYVAIPLGISSIFLADRDNLPLEGGLFRLYVNADKLMDLLYELIEYSGLENQVIVDPYIGNILLRDKEQSDPLINWVSFIYNNFDVLGYDLEGPEIDIDYNVAGEAYSSPIPKSFTSYEVRIRHPYCYIPCDGNTSPAAAYENLSQADKVAIREMWHDFFHDPECFRIEYTESGLSGATLITKDQYNNFSDFTLRDMQSALFETSCQFGRLDRITNEYKGIELNHSRLYPTNTLYPSNSLYPGGGNTSSFASTYSQLWVEENNVRKWRYLIITYKTLDENNQETEAVLQRTIDEDGTDDYNMSDNWLLKNLIWTAADVEAIADAMVAKMQDITWFPFEMWLPGLPYIETGDEIEVSINGNTYPTYVLQRQLKGIQNLQDTYINGTLDIF